MEVSLFLIEKEVSFKFILDFPILELSYSKALTELKLDNLLQFILKNNEEFYNF